MGAERRDKAQVFNAAAEIDDPAKRAVYLDGACGDDSQLRAEIEDLLRHDVDAGSFLERPVAGERPTEVLDALTDREGRPAPISPFPEEVSLDFLKPCDLPGRLGRLGPYEVIEVIGRGGMGVVLRAHEPKLNRVVAVKVLAPEFAANPTARKRFLREAQAAAAVSHPHVVSIHAVDEAENMPYLVMECIDGVSLQEKIERVGHLKLKEILRIGSQIAAGLAAAHSQGLIHRDVKPGNILLENGVERVKITDFGLARAVDDIGTTRTGEVVGTPQYMSPEQAQGDAVDHRSDLFSLGSVLYAMCTGRSPFRAETTVAALRRVCDDKPRPIREVNPETPDALVAIIDRLLAKNPDQRFQTSQEVADLLGRHLAHLQHPTSTPPPGPMGVAQGSLAQARPPSRRRQWAVAALILLVLVGSLGITEATGVTRLTTTVIRIATGEGTLVIEIDDPTVTVSIDGEEFSISGAGVEELRLRPGEYQFRATKDGKPIMTELVTISRGGRVVVRVTMESLVLSDAESRRPPPLRPPLYLEPGAPPLAVAPFDAAKAKKHQQAWADYLKVPVEHTNSIGMKLVLIPPGEFDMGSTKEEQEQPIKMIRKHNFGLDSMDFVLSESPRHRVRITRPFYFGQYEITVSQFQEFVYKTDYKTDAETNGMGGMSVNRQTGKWEGHKPEYSWRNAFPGQTNQYPVVNVNWSDAVAFCEWLSREEGKTYRLPTEAEWEYACRAGATTRYFFGDSSALLEQYAWFCRIAQGTAHPAGQKTPSSWGLYDILGNAEEWCSDWMPLDYYLRSPLENPTGPAPTPSRGRVVRGGAWHVGALCCRCANRGGRSPTVCRVFTGFRVVCEVAKAEEAAPNATAIGKPAIEIPAPPQPGEVRTAAEAIDRKDAKTGKHGELDRLEKEAEEPRRIGDESKPREEEPKQEKPNEQVPVPGPA